MRDIRRISDNTGTTDDNAAVKAMRRNILKAAVITREGHIASAFSVLDILYVLYRRVLNVDCIRHQHPGRDYFLLSKGHAAMALYAVLSNVCGYFLAEELNTYCLAGSRLGAHPDRHKVPGAEVSTGSLGHGLPQAVGLAMALKYENSPQQVYCLIGDGEMNEGSVWESLLLAAQHKLSNLTVILDNNRSTEPHLCLQNAILSVIQIGWSLYDVNGHDHSDLERCFKIPAIGPKFINATTVKGYGVKTLEQSPQMWHHRIPTEEELEKFLEELR